MKSDLAIGSTAAVTATVIPDTLLTYSGKFVFAVVMAVITSVISYYVRVWLDSKRGK